MVASGDLEKLKRMQASSLPTSYTDGVPLFHTCSTYVHRFPLLLVCTRICVIEKVLEYAAPFATHEAALQRHPFGIAFVQGEASLRNRTTDTSP